MIFFFLLNACQLPKSVRAGHGGDGQHVSHITSVKDFYNGPRIRQNITELPARSFNKVLTGKSEWTPTHRILTMVHESPEILIHFFFAEDRRPVIPVQVRWRVSSALAIWSGFFSNCCYSSGWFRSAVLANGDIQHSLNALRASNRFEGWPEAARWINSPKKIFIESISVWLFHRWKSPILNLALLAIQVNKNFQNTAKLCKTRRSGREH